MRNILLKVPLLAGAALLLCAPPGAAQMGTSRPSFSAPAAASLGRFGEVPVSLHTGQPDIRVPLFTAEGRTLQLPVSLRYQSGGVRLDDVGSWVGMGWALEAGGVITRSVRGLPDDSYYGYWNTGHVFYDPLNWPAPATQASTYNLFENMRSGYVDGEPDQFFFNFAGRGGQFVMGPTGASASSRQVVTTPRQDIRIEPQNNFRTWVVTVEDGTRYTFAATDSTLDMTGTSTGTSGYVVVNRPRFISSWHLTEIRSPAGDVIRLHYSTYIARHRLTDGAGKFFLVDQLNNCAPQTTDFIQYNGQEFKANRLDSITSAAHTIRFIPDATLRADALDEGGARQEPRLAQVEVRTPAGVVLRRFVLDHDYFGGNRLRLKSVQEQDAAGNGLPPWTFEYDPQSFPARGTFSQDHGGFWNGKANPSLVPAQVANYTLPDGFHTWSLPGANREPDVSFARVGSLSRITYPTGGTTQFTWELHDYGATRHGYARYDSLGAEQTVYASHNTYIPNSRTSTTTFSLPGTDSMTVSLEVVQYCTLGMTSCAYASITGPGLNRTYTASTTTSIRLAAGVTYTLTATSPTSTQFSTASIYIRYRQVYQITGRKAGSGLRIAEVRTTDGHGGSEVKKYRYRLLSDSTFSSGWMDYEPVYMEHVFTNNHIDRCEFFSRTATSMLALGASSNIAYREVTVLHGENGEFGRTREVFRNSIDNPDNAPLTPKPNIRVSSTEGRSGQRLRATEYNASGQVQQRTESKFTFRWNDSLTTRRFRGMSLVRWTGYTGTFGTGYFPIETQYGFGAFEVTSEWGYQTADTVYTYDEAGNASVWTGRNYTYDNPQHQQVTQLDEGSSDGRRRITRMRYPSDYASVPLSSDPDGLEGGEAYAYALTRMKDSLHIHSPVIEKWISEVVGGTERVLQAEFAPWQTYLTVEGRSALPAGRMVLAAPGPVTDFTPGSIQGTWLTWDENRFLWHQQINGYDPYGRLREVVDENNSVYTYTYGGNAGSAFLTRISHSLVDGAPLVAETGYDSRGYRSWTRDEAGTLRSYTFDGFGRLVQVRNEAGTPLQGLAYTYSRTAANGWTYQPGTPNSVTDTTYLAHTPSVSAIVSTGYLDGLGRPVQTVLRDGASWHVTARQYDASGRTWRLWKPYTRTTGGYDASFAASATAFYNADLGVSNAQPFTDSLFTPDPLRRPRSLVSEYVGSTPTAVTTVAYGIDAASGLRYSETTDPAGKKTRSYVDGFGYSVRNTLGYGTAEASTAQVAFNALGQQTQLTDPRGIVTTYTRDTRGLMTTRANPDGGTRNVKYTRAGTVRFAQDARQAAAGRVWFTSYDNAGRPLVSGEGPAVFSSLDPREGNPEPMETATANWLLVRRYDAKPSTSAFPWSLFATQIAGLTLNNVGGRLAASASKSSGAWQAELFSYDADGEVAARYTFTQAGGGGVLAALNTTLTYTRDLRGEVTQRAMTVGASSFYQWYEFDGRGLLARVYASTSATRPAAADAAYTYRPAGGVRERQYQDGPLVPLRYTIREQIERIGDPASTAYPFSARYSYHPNGRLQETEFYSAGSPAASKRYGYVFGTGSWDALNRMRSADFSPWAGTGWSTTAAHDLTGITYDAAGNITVLGRYNQAGAVVDNLAYGYGTTTNRLGSVTDYAGATAEAWDAETGGFTYDANGNLLTAPAPYSISAATYDYQNLPLSFTAGGVTSTYRYNGEGQRIGRQVGAGNIDFYLKEGPATLGVMTLNAAGTPASWHFNLLAGDQVVGRLTNTGSRRYYHRDMNRSTRAVVENGLVVESYDYDPWGVLMPGRTLAGPTREGFTGKEYDPETGLTYFGARYYMAALGRWTSVDPSADTYLNWSPYNYVLGDPMLFTDPFGLDPCEDSKAWTDCIALWLAAWGARNGNNFALYGGAALSAGLEVTGINTAAAAGNDIGEGNFVEGLKGVALSVGATWLGGRLGASGAARLAGSHVDEAAGAAAGRLGSEAVDHIVLGYADEGLRATAAKVGGRHLMEDTNWRRTVMDAAANGRARITVSLDGMTGANPAEKLMNAALRGSRPPAAGMAPRATDWEMSVLYEVRRFRNVDLVQTVNGVLQHVPNPFR